MYRLRIYAPISTYYDAIRVFQNNSVVNPRVEPAGDSTPCYDEYVDSANRSIVATFLTDTDFNNFASVFSRWVINVDGVISYQTPTASQDYECFLLWANLSGASNVYVRLELGTPVTPASLTVGITATGPTKAQLNGVFAGGESSYAYQRYLRVTIDNFGTFDVYSAESYGGENTFSTEITGLSENTTYTWSATLYVKVTGGWVATTYTASGAFVTSKSVGSAYIYTDQWRLYVPYIHNGVKWEPYTAKIYTYAWR